MDVTDAQSLALFAAPLIAKAAESIGDSLLGKVADEAVSAGWEKVMQMVARVRAWFSECNDEDGEEVLRGVLIDRCARLPLAFGHRRRPSRPESRAVLARVR